MSSPTTISHHDLCNLAARWLRNKHRCSVVLTDPRTFATWEQPDAIGWTNRGYSILIECKTSLKDFKKDTKKRFRLHPTYGMGIARFFAFPQGFTAKHRIQAPMGWGIVEFGTKARVLVQPTPFPVHARAEELRLLVTCVRRLIENWGRGIFGEHLDQSVIGPDPHPSRVIQELRTQIKQLEAMTKVVSK